ncbi:epididymal secretory glutathione peroxidase-like [Tamandua tetradactyla]|uniref:epididymal secretory glutathione peroxidase-like n=1 Tax=Tamandua tetradactyla TaxID=48850 RepID=UPI0040549381
MWSDLRRSHTPTPPPAPSPAGGPLASAARQTSQESKGQEAREDRQRGAADPSMAGSASCLFPLLLIGFAQPNPADEPLKMPCYRDVTGTIYEYGARALSGQGYVQFRRYAGQHVLFVNVATYCGLTAQYPELNALQEELKPFGLVVLGFPCNQFGKQEPGENSEILSGLKHVRPGNGYVPSFQLFEKGDVNGEKEQKVFTFLKHSCPHPSEVLGSPTSISWEPLKVHDIRWNFEKFLVGPDGVPVLRWHHRAPVSTVRLDLLEYLKPRAALGMQGRGPQSTA